MKLRVMALPLILAVAACGYSKKGNEVPTVEAKEVSSARAEGVSPAEARAVPQSKQPNEQATSVVENESERFNCLGLKSGEYDTDITLSDWAVGGDHMGPQATYKVTGNGEFKGATGWVRLSGYEYEFLDGKLGQLHAKIVPSSQGFYTILVNDTGAQCEKEGGE